MSYCRCIYIDIYGWRQRCLSRRGDFGADKAKFIIENR